MAMPLATAPLERETISTTLPALPFPPLESRPPIRTPRLVLRRTLPSDAAAFHALRTQPEVMTWTAQGVPDLDEAASQALLARRLAPDAAGAQQFDFVICRADAAGELVGVGGCLRSCGELGWPVVGYMLRREVWGRGYATEFLAAFLDAWWALPRVPVAELRVDGATVRAADNGVDAREAVVAVALDNNGGSRRVLEKCGFELAKIWREPDSRNPSQDATLCGYVAWRPGN